MRTALLLAFLAACPLAGCLQPAGNGWAAHATGLDALRERGLRGSHVRVAILDTGVDLGHPSLRHLADGDAGNGELAGFRDFLGSAVRPRDQGGHGTFVAGVLAASPPRGAASVTGAPDAVEGLAPGVHLLVGRVCHVEACSLAALWRGLEWALAEEADVVSLSLGFTQAQLQQRGGIADRVRQALALAEERGVLVVAAAGNGAGRAPGQPGEPVLFPASEPTVLAVGAMDRDGALRASSAPDGAGKPDLVAPGQAIVGPDRGRGRVSMDGTSAAVPFVTAAAALLMSGAGDPVEPRRLQDLRDALRDTARPLAGQRVPHDPHAGHGLLQADAALAAYRASWGLAPRPQAP